MKKKKVILAMLASLCIAASATAFAACEDTTSGDTKDPALYAAYQTYAEGNDDALDYDEWVASIIDMLYDGGIEGPKGDDGQDGISIVDVDIVVKEGVKYFVFTLSNGDTKEVEIK